MYPPQDRREAAPPSDVTRELFYGIVWLGLAALDRFTGHGVGMSMVLAVGAFVSAIAYRLGLPPKKRVLVGLAWFGLAFAFWLVRRG